jgi:hypothetical protein
LSLDGAIVVHLQFDLIASERLQVKSGKVVTSWVPVRECRYRRPLEAEISVTVTGMETASLKWV